MNTNKDSVVKQSGNDVDSCRSQKVCFNPIQCNMGDYIDILINVHLKCLHMNYDNLFMFQLHPRSLKQVFRLGGKINE